MTDPEPRPRNHRITGTPAAPPVPPDLSEPPASEIPPVRPRRNWSRLWWGLGGVLVVGGLAASWFALPVRTVRVEGNARLTEAQVRRLAGLTPGFAWPYYGTWRAGNLRRNPWIRSAVVTRRFPDTVEVRVSERLPFARLAQPGGRVVVLAEDGTVLPGAQGAGTLPLLSGRGPGRVGDALYALRALRGYNVHSVAYTPSGITAKTASGTVWSGDLKNLLKYAGALVQFPNKTIHTYPWGVSVQE